MGSSRSPKLAPPATSSAASGTPFGYRALAADGPLVPAIPLVVHGPRGRIATPGLLDSGADNSMFPLAWAKLLGIDKADCDEADCSTVAGLTKQYIWKPGVDAEIQALATTVHLNACFAEGLPIILLGRGDFFQSFRVSIDQQAQSFTLEPY